MITLTERAVDYFTHLERCDNEVVVLGIDKKGCGGLTHTMELVDRNSLNSDFIVYTVSGVTFATTVVNENLIQGLEIDYSSENFTKEVRFNNPNLNPACGCGKSFSLKT